LLKIWLFRVFQIDQITECQTNRKPFLDFLLNAASLNNQKDKRDSAVSQ
jgi:hypothetical protein